MGEKAMIKKCAKALYLVGNLEHMFVYLDALYDGGWITVEESEKLVESISKECAPITCGEIEKLRGMF